MIRRFGKARVEVGVFKHAGRSFSALGSIQDPDRGILVGYVKEKEPGRFVLTTWDGKQEIAPLRRTSTWKTPRSRMSSSMSNFTTQVDGVTYAGRGGGNGMLLKMRAKKKRR